MAIIFKIELWSEDIWYCFQPLLSPDRSIGLLLTTAKKSLTISFFQSMQSSMAKALKSEDLSAETPYMINIFYEIWTHARQEWMQYTYNHDHYSWGGVQYKYQTATLVTCVFHTNDFFKAWKNTYTEIVFYLRNCASAIQKALSVTRWYHLQVNAVTQAPRKIRFSSKI